MNSTRVVLSRANERGCGLGVAESLLTYLPYILKIYGECDPSLLVHKCI